MFEVFYLILSLCLTALSGCFYYYQTLKKAMPIKRWTVAGAILGPLAWPMFNMQVRINMIRKHGFDSALIQL